MLRRLPVRAWPEGGRGAGGRPCAFFRRKDGREQFFFVFLPTTTNKRKMSAIGRFWVRLKRIRHRRGYGVHSPFAFNFLTYVVYERGEYYAYRDLAARHPVPFFRCGGHLAKCRKFLFR